MTALEVVRAAPGLDEYLADVEVELGRSVGRYPGLVREVGAGALAAGGKRLRPALAFLSSSPDAEPPVAAGVAVELVHMATLVHDDLIDGAVVRRGRAAAWSEHGEDAARASGDYLFARAFAVLAETGDASLVAVLADASLALARGEAMQRRQRHDPDTSIEDYLERCALKTGKLFEAACVLGGGSGEYGRRLGIAFQIADDVLDCTGETARRRSRCCSLRRQTRSCATRSPGVRRKVSSSASRRAARSTGLVSWPSTTLRRPGPASTACRVGTSSRR